MRDPALRRSSQGFASIIVLAMFQGGCEAADQYSQAVQERDSAGVRIVESSAPAWNDRQLWSLSEAPALEIGSATGDPSTLFYQVQAVRRFDDGRILIVNMGTNDLRVYSPTGQHMQTIGREGRGPGEFRYPRNAWIGPDDSLFVVDIDRASVFDPEGRYIRSAGFGIVRPQDRFDDGSYLRVVYTGRQDGSALGYSRPKLAVVRSSLDGTVADTIAELPGTEIYLISQDGGFISSYRAPFGLEQHIALHRGSLYSADGSATEVYELDGAGILTRILRRPGERDPVTPAAIQAFEDAMLETARNDQQRQRWHQVFREWTYPSFQPVFDELVVDRAGNIWVRHFTVSAEGQIPWTIFGSDGRWLGDLEIPASLQVKEVGTDYVLGLWTDDAGVEYVRLYDLEK